MKTNDIETNVPIIISKFLNHTLLKEKTLQLIEEFSDTSQVISNSADQISKTDWNTPDDEKKYQTFIKPHLIQHTADLFKNYNAQGIRFGNIWFQQYNQDDTHDWHIHGLCHFTNVYFLELPCSTMKTEIKDFYGNLINYEIEEGDIITFPSFFYHKSSKNISQRKTIISFNINLL